MSKCLLVGFVLISLAMLKVDAQDTDPPVCPRSKIRIITLNETLLPRTPEHIQASREFPQYPAPQIVNYGPNHTQVWCSPPSETEEQPVVFMNFTEDVVLVGLISGGYTYSFCHSPFDIVHSGMREYVRGFYLDYSLDPTAEREEDNFIRYSLSEEAEEAEEAEEVFQIDETNLDQLILFPKLVTVRKLRMQVVDSEVSTLSNDTCWSLAFLGCLQAEVRESLPAMNTRSQACNNDAVAIALPTVITVIAVAIAITMTTIATVLTCKYHRKDTERVTGTMELTSKAYITDNTAIPSPSKAGIGPSALNRTETNTSRTVFNSLYKERVENPEDREAIDNYSLEHEELVYYASDSQSDKAVKIPGPTNEEDRIYSIPKSPGNHFDMARNNSYGLPSALSLNEMPGKVYENIRT